MHPLRSLFASILPFSLKLLVLINCFFFELLVQKKTLYPNLFYTLIHKANTCCIQVQNCITNHKLYNV